MDPLDALGPLCFTNILANLSPKALRACARVCKSWRPFADESAAWDKHCTELWSDKVYLPAAISQMADRKAAYRASLIDAKRVEITIDELCDPTWSFKFKSSAGTFYTLVAEHEMHRHFHRDHTLTSPKADPLWGALEPTYVWSFRGRKEGKRGLYVQVNRYPSLDVTRDEKWGWRMENLWVEFCTSDPSVTAAGANPGPPKGTVVSEAAAAAAAIAQLLDEAEIESDEDNDGGDVVIEVLAAQAQAQVQQQQGAGEVLPELE